MLLILLQAWSSSVYNCLPAVYSSTESVLEGKAAVRRWDWLHFLLTGSLAVVSATLGYYITRERLLVKRLALTNAELSKLLFKVGWLIAPCSSPCKHKRRMQDWRWHSTAKSDLGQQCRCAVSSALYLSASMLLKHVLACEGILRAVSITSGKFA